MNSNETERIRFAQWLLERHLGWIAAVEIKAAFVVALDTAMVAGLGAVYMASSSPRTLTAVIASGFAIVLAGIALACIAFAVFPRTKGSEVTASLVYFGDVKSKDLSSFVETLASITDAEILRELATQVHRNASIALEKHKLVQNAIACSFLSGVAWFVAMVVLIKV